MQFEKSLLEDAVGRMRRIPAAAISTFGYESGVERVLQLMDKATTTEVMTKHPQTHS